MRSFVCARADSFPDMIHIFIHHPYLLTSSICPSLSTISPHRNALRIKALRGLRHVCIWCSVVVGRGIGHGRVSWIPWTVQGRRSRPWLNIPLLVCPASRRLLMLGLLLGWLLRRRIPLLLNIPLLVYLRELLLVLLVLLLGLVLLLASGSCRAVLLGSLLLQPRWQLLLLAIPTWILLHWPCAAVGLHQVILLFAVRITVSALRLSCIRPCPIYTSSTFLRPSKLPASHFWGPRKGIRSRPAHLRRGWRLGWRLGMQYL